MRRFFTVAISFAAFITLMGAGTYPFMVAPPGPTGSATPQVTMNPFAVVQGDAGSNPIDMGPTPDNFVVNADWNQEPVNTGNTNYCGSTAASNCVTYKYIDHLRNFCQTTQTQQVLTDAGLPATFAPGTTAPQGAETWFTHFATTNPTPTAPGTPFRNVAADTGANCAAYWGNLATPTAPPTGISFYTLPFLMNPDDANFRQELINCCWTNTGTNYYPQTQNATTPPYNVYEDNSQILGRFITGDTGPRDPFASEYGCWWGSPPGQTCRIDLVGTNPYHVADDWDTAIGKFANSACGSPCLKMTLNGASPGANITPVCNIWNGTNDCHDQVYTGYIDNTFEKTIAKVIAANSSGNITDFDMESPIFNHVFPAVWGGPALLDAVLNTWINFQKDAATNSVTITDLEPGWGPGGKGDTTSSVRLASIAMEWLTPDYSATKSSNDRIIPRRLPIGGTLTESPSFFELFLVPYGPEQTVQSYTMHNDATQTTTIGGGCHGGVMNAQGDTHGIIDLLQACAQSDDGGVYCLQYHQLWFNHHNYGPMAVCMNTSTTDSFTITSSWFTVDPFSTYHYALSLAKSEMKSVAQGNIGGGGIATFTTCTNNLYCVAGGNTMASNTSSIPGTLGPHSGLVLMATNQ